MRLVCVCVRARVCGSMCVYVLFFSHTYAVYIFHGVKVCKLYV